VKFAFGENWLRFLDHVDEPRLDAARRALRDELRVDDLYGRSFLDAGAGSGLSSLAALQLDASAVLSFDSDPDCVACARLLKDRFAPNQEHWSITADDLTDPSLGARIGRFDVVHCFGVLHHTGAMWRALDNLVATVAPGGLLYLSIYNSQGVVSDRWRKVKRLYNRLPRLVRPLYAAAVWAPFELRWAIDGLRHAPRAYLRTWTHRDRGMSKWHDIVDWVGGYPFEVARPEEVVDRCRHHDFELVHLKSVGDSSACNEFLFQRRPIRTTVTPS
jgi:2-polyprenyl-3-methyl-5-hydroxy-6-metoxy-1,4-benzoquinol methylase